MSDGASNRLYRMGERLAIALSADPEYQSGDKVILIFRSGDDWGACVTAGYKSDGESIGDLVNYVQMICRDNGATMIITGSGIGLDVL